MKKILVNTSKFLTVWCMLLMIVGCVMSTTGCAGLSDRLSSNDIAVRVGIQYATVKYIEGRDDPEKSAGRIVNIAEAVKLYAAGEEKVLVDALFQELSKRVPWDELDAADTILARALIDAIRVEMARRVGSGTIDEDTVYAVDAIADMVIQAAKAGVP